MIRVRAEAERNIKSAAGEKIDRAVWFWRGFIIGPMVSKYIKVTEHRGATADQIERGNSSVCKEKI